MSVHRITADEEEQLRKIGNYIFDVLCGSYGGDGKSEGRAEFLAQKADSALRKALEDGE
jgi:hypothetical protein